MNRTILALCCVLGIVFTIGLHITNPVTQQHRQQMNNLRYQEARAILPSKVMAISVLYWIAIAILLAVAIVILLAIYFRFIHPIAVQARQAHLERIREIETKGQFSQPSFEGVSNVHYHPITNDSHNQTVTQHYKAPQQLIHKPIDSLLSDFSVNEPVITIPSFRQALDDATSSTLVLGYDEEGKAKHGTLEQLFSFGVGGLPDAGKTSVTIWLLSQAIRQGAQLIVIDPHAGNPDSLASRLQPLAHAYLCQVASTPNEMLQSIRYAQSLFEQRRSEGGADGCYIIFVCDEWLACMRNGLKDEFHALAEAVSQEGRKYRFIGAFLSQKWDIAKSGDMRDTLTSHIFCRTRKNLARQQTGLVGRELPDGVMTLAKGTFYLLDTIGQLTLLQAPYVSQVDLQMLASELAGKREPRTIEIPPPIITPDLRTQTKPQDKPVDTLNPEQAQILNLFKQEKSIREIIFELYGVKSGAKYNSYLSDVQAVLRGQLKQNH